ncbi:MAG TPA: methyl-accepting chemotaxis protein [Clostridium sp.]|nr:methyl-accepting chemotaxis protein [Clostridium sp.]
MGNKKEKNNEKMSIKTKLLIVFLSIGIAPILIFAIISGVIIQSSMYKREVASLKQISSMVTENIDKWGDDNIILAEDIASSQIVLSNDIEGIQKELRNKQAQDTGILNIMYVDFSGNVLADSLGSKNENINSESYFEEVTKGYSYVSNVLKDDNNRYIIFSSPIKVDNAITGYIINKVKINSIGECIGKITYSKEGQVYTFNNDGYITYHSDSDKIMNENILDSKGNLSSAVEKALEGNFNSVNYSYKDEKGVAVYNFIPSLKWGIMTTIPNSDIYKGVKNVFMTFIPVVIIIVAIIIVLVLYISKIFGKIISDIDLFTQEVASGNLTVNCQLSGAKELVDIGDNLNGMAESLKDLVVSISGKSNFLKNESEKLNGLSISAEDNSRDISKAMEEIAEGSVSQAEKTDDVLNHVRELDGRMNQLTQKVEETNDVIKLSDIALTKGNNGTMELKKSTEEQFRLVAQAVKEVNELGDFIGNIDNIIETIQDITEQTSLLALNASIEAARAGESGKGFAVVAEEVAKLADESQKATAQTATILESIRNKTDEARKIMVSIDNGMKRQANTVNETMNIFEEITCADNKISENIKSFSDLSEYIKGFSDELLQLIETLASSAEESAAVSEEVTASSDDQLNVVGKVKMSGDNILQIVNELKENIDKFKTEEEKINEENI